MAHWRKKQRKYGSTSTAWALMHLIALMLYLIPFLVFGAVLLSLDSLWNLLRRPFDRHAKDEGQGKRLLREVVKEGLEFIPFDRDKSDVNWTVQDGKLIGGLTGIKGIGNRVAKDILERRKLRQPLTPRQDTLLSLGKTPYNDIFECERKFGHIKSDPAAHKIVSKISDIDEITEENYGSFVFFGKVKDREVKDLNERPGTRKVSGASLSLNLTLEDDTSQIICTIDRFKYPRLGLPIVADGKIGDWLLIKGNSRKGFRRIYVEKYRNMD